jgi:ketosteroid isomerase-like protein
MSEENVNAARQPITLKPRVARTLFERLALRFPGIRVAIARATLRLPPHAWPRQKMLGYAVRLGYEATNRGDQEACFVLYHPDVESIWPPELVALGFDPPSRGRAERIEAQRRWAAEWQALRFEPEELIDLGDRALVAGRIQGSGLTSGATVELNDWAVLFNFSGGQVIREQIFVARADALEAAGLSE